MENRKIIKAGIEFAISYEYDEYQDASYLGKYSDTYTKGAIDRKAMGDLDRGELRYFIPENTFADHISGWSEFYATEREARSIAAQYVLEEYKRSESFNNDEWSMMIVTVSASLDGIQITKLSVCGIESDSDDEYLRDTENDLINEILHDLPEQAMRLRRDAQDRMALASKLDTVAKEQV